MTGNAADQPPARSSLEDIASAAAHLLQLSDDDLAPHADTLLRLELALGDVERVVYPLDDDLGDPEGAIAAESAPESETARHAGSPLPAAAEQYVGPSRPGQVYRYERPTPGTPCPRPGCGSTLIPHSSGPYCGSCGWGA